MNYVILRPITTLIALITDIFGLYGQGRVDFSKSYVYLTATTNFSQVSPGMIIPTHRARVATVNRLSHTLL